MDGRNPSMGAHEFHNQFAQADAEQQVNGEQARLKGVEGGFYTAQELAGLPGLPGTERNVRALAKRHSWKGQRRLGSKAIEYAFDELPQETQTALTRRAAIEAAQTRLDSAAADFKPAATPEEQAQAYALELRQAEEAKNAKRRAGKQAGMKKFAALPSDSPKRLRAKARETVLLSMWDFRRRGNMTMRAAMIEFAELASAGDTALPDSVWQWMPEVKGHRTITFATLKRWHYDYREHGIWGLVDGYGTRKAQFKVRQIEGLEGVVIGLMLQQPHITPKKIKGYVQAKHPALNRVSVKGYERFMTWWKTENAQAYTYATNPDAWKNSYMAAVGSHHERIERLNQVWELDSTPGDWLLADGRHSVIGTIDLYSRRFKLYVSKTSTAKAVCQVFRRAVLDWGICEIARTDNGKDYVSQQFTSVLRDLEVEQELCLPFASEQKGTVERAFRTMSHGILDLLPGFIGHNVAERKVIEARKSFAQRIMTQGETVEVEMTSEELQQVLDQWCMIYHHTAHSGLDGKTPFEVSNAWVAPVSRIKDERALDLLLAEIGGTRVIGKKGIRFEGNSYDAPALFEHVGRSAVLKRDEADIGRLYVYVDGEFIAVAECAELLGISRKERAAASRAAQKRFVGTQQKEFRDFKKGVDRNIGQVVLEHQLEQIQNIETLHRPSIDYTPEGLRQAQQAAKRELPPIPAPAAPEYADARAKLMAEMNQSAAPVAEVDTPKRRYERWLRLDRRAKNGEQLPQAEAAFYHSYPKNGEYRSMASVFEDLGTSAFGERT